MPPEKKVKELMIPLTDYPHIPYWFTIKQAMALARKASLDGEGKAAPRALLVFDEQYRLLGSLTMPDLIRGIEKKFVRASGFLSKEWDTPVFFEGLFTEEAKMEAQKPVSDVMSPVADTVAPDDPIMRAIFIMMESSSSLLPVIDRGNVAGVIRMEEIFNEIVNLVMEG